MKNDRKKIAISRREFFAALVPVFSVPVLLWWIFTGKRDMEGSGRGKKIIIGNDLPAGISFQQGLILVKDGDTTRAFEGKCTHLGCRIKKFEGNELVCSCHGSRFDISGKAVKGPAIKPLKELIINEDLLSGQLIIHRQ